MAVKPNGTDAKDVALYFLKMTDTPITPPVTARSIKQVKSLLEKGYSKDNITVCIDHVVLKWKANVYSMGYIATVIDDVLIEIVELKHKARIKAEIQKAELEQSATIVEDRQKVSVDDESAERNRRKSEKFDVKSRLGKKFDFDMFKGK